MAKRKNKSDKKKSKKRLFKHWKQLSFRGKIWRFIWVTILALFGFSIFQVLFCAVFNPPITPLMVTRFFQQAKDPDRAVRFERDYVPLDKISPFGVIDNTFVFSKGWKVNLEFGCAGKGYMDNYLESVQGNAEEF